MKSINFSAIELGTVRGSTQAGGWDINDVGGMLKMRTPAAI